MQGNSDLDYTNRSTDSSLNFSRRAVLAATTGLTVGLAGCSSSGQSDPETTITETDADSGGSSDTSSGGVFEEIGFEGRELQVTVSDDAVARINVVQDGEQVGSGEFSTGVTTATVWSANQTLHGEEFELIAVDEEENQIGSTTVSFAAKPDVAGIRTQAMKNDREATAEVAKEYTDEFSIALVTIENTGDAPLILGSWRYNYDGTTVFLTDGVPQAVGSEKRNGLDEPNESVLVPVGGSVEVVPYVPAYKHLKFQTTGGERDAWPESVRSMGEFPDGYADGDEVDVPIIVEDDTGEQFEFTVTATYEGGLLDLGGFNTNTYVPAEFSA